MIEREPPGPPDPHLNHPCPECGAKPGEECSAKRRVGRGRFHARRQGFLRRMVTK